MICCEHEIWYHPQAQYTDDKGVLSSWVTTCEAEGCDCSMGRPA